MGVVDALGPESPSKKGPEGTDVPPTDLVEEQVSTVKANTSACRVPGEPCISHTPKGRRREQDPKRLVCWAKEVSEGAHGRRLAGVEQPPPRCPT